jgi:L-2-hydroxycarboxylate dehydrogenase (NAD+)
VKVKLDELKQLVHKALLMSGFDEEQAKAVGEVMLYAQLRGNNQGIVKLIGAGYHNDATGPVEVVKEGKVSALLDAHQNGAMVAVNKAVAMASAKAKEHGIAVVGINGVNTSSGAIGFYVRKMAEDGLVGMIFAGSMNTVAPAGSFQALFGTNPLAFGIPGKTKPVILDMATAAMAYYGVVEANTAGRQLPEGIAYDKDGNSTTDPAKVIDDGALRTFDGSYKGSHLSMMVQALASPLVGAAFMGVGDGAKNSGGHLVIAIDPEVLGGLDALREQMDVMVKTLKSAKRLPGVDEILMPSERGDRIAEAAEKAGELEIEDNLYRELQKVAAD